MQGKHVEHNSLSLVLVNATTSVILIKKMFRNYCKTMGTGLIFVVLTACAHLTCAINQNQAQATDSYSEFASAMNRFAGHMYQLISSQSGNDNVVFSPLSITQVMGMLLAGAKGNTRDEMRTALKVSHKDQSIHKYLGSVQENATAETTGPTFNMANGMFIENGYTLFENYSALLQNEYSATVQNVSFSNAHQAVKIINDWVALHTENMIQKLLKPDMIDSLTRLVLTNAIFFDAQWKNKFQLCPNQMQFKTAQGNSLVSCMKLHTNLPWYADKIMQYTALPYDSNPSGNSYMVIGLPYSYHGKTNNLETFASNAQDLLGNLDPTAWYTQEVRLFMPKFNVSRDVDVKEVLMKMGVVDLFSEVNSNLSGISGEPLHVSDFLHKARIEVNERGTKAAAASAAIVVARTLSFRYFRLDRPFFFGIYNVPTKLFTFVGKVENPLIE